MDAGKRKTLVDWVNSLGVGDCIESLKQLTDGQHLFRAISLIDPEQSPEDRETPSARFSAIGAFIEGAYQVSINGKLDLPAVVVEENEFETAKICLLLMAASLVSEQNVLFVERAEKLDTVAQLDMREMVEWVLQPGRKLQGIDSEFAQILYKKIEKSPASGIPQMASTPSRIRALSGQVSATVPELRQTPGFSTSLQGGNISGILSHFASPKIQSPGAMSPVQQMVQSPQMANKILLQQKEMRIKRLSRDIGTEKKLRSDLEDDIRYKDDILEQRDNTIKELQAQTVVMEKKIRKLENQMENCQSPASKRDELQTEIEKYQNRAKMVKELKENKHFLEKDNTELYKEVSELKQKVTRSDSWREECSQMKDLLHNQAEEIESLRNDLEARQKDVVGLNNIQATLENEIEELKEIHRQHLEGVNETIPTDSISSPNESGRHSILGETLGGVLEKQLREQIEELESQLQQQENAHVQQFKKDQAQLQEQLKQLDESELLVSSLQEDLQTVRDSSMILEESFKKSEQNVKELQNHMETLTNQKVDLEGMLQQSKNETTSLEEEKMQLLQDNKEHKLMNESLWQDLELSKSHCSKLELELQNSSSRCAEFEEKVTCLNRELVNSKEMFQTKTVEAEKIMSNLASLNEKYASVEEQHLQLKTERDEINEELLKTSDLLRKAENVIQEKSVENVSLKADIDQRETVFGKLYVEMTEQSKEKEIIKEERETIKQEKKETGDKLSESEQENHKLREHMEEINNQKMEVERNLQESKNHVITLEEKVVGMAEGIKESEKVQTELTQTLDQTRELSNIQSAKLEHELQNSKLQASQLEEKVTGMTLELEDTKAIHQAQVAEMESNKFGLQEMLEKAEEKCATLEEQSTTLQQWVDKTKEKHDQVCSQLREAEKELQERMDAFVSVKADMDQKETVLQQVQNQLTHQSEHIGLIAEEKEKIAQDKKEAEEKLSQSKQENHELRGHLEVLTKEKAELELNLKGSNDQIQDVERKLENVEEIMNEAKKLNETLQQNLEVSKTDNDELRNHVKKLINQKTALESNLKVSMDKASDFGEQIENLKEDVNKAEKLNESLSQTLQQTSDLSKLDNNKLKDHMETLVIQKSEVEMNLKISVEKANAFEEQIETLKEEVNEAKKLNESLSQTLNQTREVSNTQSAKLESELQNSKLCCTELEDEIKMLTTESEEQIETLKEEVNEAKKLNENLQKNSELSKIDNHELRNHVTALESNLKVSMDKASDFAEQIENLKEDVSKAEKLNERLSQTLQQTSDLSKLDNNKLKDHMETLVNQKSELEINLKISVEKANASEEQIETLKEDVNEAKKLNESLSQTLNQTREVSNTQSAKLESELQNSKLRCTELENEIKMLTTELQEMKAAHKVQVTEIESNKSDLQGMLEKANEKCIALEEQSTTLQQWVDKTKEKVCEAEKEIQEQMESFLSVKDDINQKETVLQKLQEQLTQQTKEKKEILDEKEKIAQEKKQSEDKLSESERENQELRANIKVVTDQRSKLEKMSNEHTGASKENILKLTEEVKEAKQIAEVSKLENSKLREINSSFRNKLQSDNDNITAMREQVAQIVQESCEKEKEYQEKLSSLQLEHEMASETMASLEEELKTLHEEKKLLQDEVELMEREINEHDTERSEALKERNEEILSLKQILAEFEKVAQKEQKRTSELTDKLKMKSEALDSCQREIMNIQESLQMTQTEGGKRINSLEQSRQDASQKLHVTEENFKALQKKFREQLQVSETKLQTLRNEMTQKQAEYEFQVEHLHRQVQHSKAHEHKYNKDIVDNQNKLKEMENQVRSLEQAKTDLEERYKDLEIASDVEVNGMNEKFQKLTEIITEKDMKFGKLETEISTMKEETEQLKHNLSEVENKRVEDIAEKNQSIHKLQEQLDGAQIYASHQKDSVVESTKQQDEKLNALETRNFKLEAEVQMYIERQQRIVTDHQNQLTKAENMNLILRKRIEEQTKEIEERKDTYSKELERIKKRFQKNTEKYEAHIELEKKRISEYEAAAKKKIANDLKEIERLTKSIAEKETLVKQLESEVGVANEVTQQYEDTNKELVSENTDLKAKFKESKANVEKLKTHIQNLEDFGDRKIKGHTISKETTFDGVPITITKLKKQTTFDHLYDQPFERFDLDLNESYTENSRRLSLRPRTPRASPNALGFSDSLRLDELSTSYTGLDRKMSNLSFDHRTPGLKRRDSISSIASQPVLGSRRESLTDLVSSATRSRHESMMNFVQPSMQTRSRRLSSTSTLSKSINHANFEPNRSLTVPRGTGLFFSTEDEPVMMEDGNRLSELQRRNTLCRPHLKTCYPVEMQTTAPKDITDDKLRIGADKITPEERRTRRKRGSMSSDSLDDSLEGSGGKRKPLASYKKAQSGSSTPGVKVVARIQNKGKSPDKKKKKKSPKAEKGSRGTPKTPGSNKRKKNTSRLTPMKKRIVHESETENEGAKGKLPAKDNLTFEIKNTPKKSRRLSKLLSSKKDVTKGLKKPLKDSNFFPWKK